jgi:hypothetical protein
MPIGPPDEKYFEGFPPTGEERERLAAYQLHRFVDENETTKERRRVAEAVFKRDLGLPLTRADQNYLGYSPFSPNVPGCHHT